MRVRRKRRSRAPLVAALITAAALALGAVLTVLPFSNRGADVAIPHGVSLREIGLRLQDAGVVPHWTLFALAAKLSPRGGRLQSGIYRFPKRISVLDAVAALATGRYQIDIWVTVPEGATIRRIASILHARLKADSAAVVRLARDPRFIRRQHLGVASLEGYLFPDTYLFKLDTTPEHALSEMVRRLRLTIDAQMQARMQHLGRSLHDILTMASLVEGETRVPDERARVAGVYYNRLKKGMLLQADPTVQYIIPDGPRRLFYRDLRIRSPYNTYLHPGLPPGPVNNPGREAILAALYPENNDYLYFVADGTGGHTFSRTPAEHASAVSRYRRIQKERAS